MARRRALLSVVPLTSIAGCTSLLPTHESRVSARIDEIVLTNISQHKITLELVVTGDSDVIHNESYEIAPKSDDVAGEEIIGGVEINKTTQFSVVANVNDSESHTNSDIELEDLSSEICTTIQILYNDDGELFQIWREC